MLSKIRPSSKRFSTCFDGTHSLVLVPYAKMAKLCHHYSIPRLISPIPSHQINQKSYCNIPSIGFTIHSISKTRASSAPASCSSWHKDETSQSQHSKKKKKKIQRAPRRLITISTSDGKWQGEWSCDYLLSLRELQLGDLAEDGNKDAKVLVNLSVQKHAGFGFSVDGRIITSFNARCCCCSSSYCKQINTTFDVWVLPYGKSDDLELPELGLSDPSVIYVKTGMEADLDSLIKDTIRLTASTKDTCSESCEKSTTVWQDNDGNVSFDGRWSRLLELKNSM